MKSGAGSAFCDICKSFVQKKSRNPFGYRLDLHFDGGATGDRTPDLRIANATLSQLSYRPIVQAGKDTGRGAAALVAVF